MQYHPGQVVPCCAVAMCLPAVVPMLLPVPLPAPRRAAPCFANAVCECKRKRSMDTQAQREC
eukprot:629879-Lingulodinium_polyedra.AAC.1